MKQILFLLAAVALLCVYWGQESSEVRFFKSTRKKAEQGNADAQNRLGWMYDYGRGVPQDDVEAAKWYRKAAEQGNDLAQNSLGGMYYFGKGVPQDDVEAAEQRIAEAQKKLGEMYYEGQSVPQDDVEAYAWFLLAKANGNEEVSKEIPILEEHLTAEQIEKGKARAAALHRLIEERKPEAVR